MANARRKQKNNRRNLLVVGMVFVGTVFVAAVTMLLLMYLGVFSPDDVQNSDDFLFRSDLLLNDQEPLGQNLELHGVGRYAGLYLEDGSNDTVSDVMMIQIKNTGDKDLQLARLSLTYSQFVAEFEITNLPAGRSVVVLEKNRHPYIEEKFLSAEMKDVAFFSANMDVDTQMFEITGMEGALNLKNISASDVTGDFYVYYKYIADDILYGGVTFRTKVEGGIKSNEIRQINAQHFDPDTCIILHISAGV